MKMMITYTIWKCYMNLNNNNDFNILEVKYELEEEIFSHLEGLNEDETFWKKKKKNDLHILEVHCSCIASLLVLYAVLLQCNSTV